ANGGGILVGPGSLTVYNSTVADNGVAGGAAGEGGHFGFSGPANSSSAIGGSGVSGALAGTHAVPFQPQPRSGAPGTAGPPGPYAGPGPGGTPAPAAR